MKRPMFFILAVMLAMTANAAKLTEQQALAKAQQFMKGKTFSITTKKRVANVMGEPINDAFYVFNAKEGGFVIVSGDDRTAPVLGYSETGRLDINAIPQALESWFQGYADQLAWLTDHPSARIAHRTINGSAISPLLGETEWAQSTPYNLHCPVTSKGYSLTGCVATAMAQIMYYHRWPAQTTKEIPGYTTNTLKLTIDSIPVSAIDWENILPKYSTSSTTIQQHAVADLMFKCGASVHMDYDMEGSGSSLSDVVTSLKEYFDYDASVSVIFRSHYGVERWNNIIYSELEAGRPVCYRGQSTTKGGHAFVIDGYDKDDYFHVNWGWEGRCNGYFLLSILAPEDTDNGYNNNQAAVIGIQKNTGTTIDEEYKDGDYFTDFTEEGIEMSFRIINVKEKICEVKLYSIDRNTTGTVTIPSYAKGFRVTSLGDYAFRECTEITSLVLPPTLETISAYAIYHCNQLKTLFIPASVSDISDGAIMNNGNLMSIVVDSLNPFFESRDGILYRKTNGVRRLWCYPSGLENEFTIPADVTEVNGYAFNHCKITKLVFPKTVIWVGSSVASGCSNLREVIWDASMTTITSYAFSNCSALSKIELSEGLQEISPYSFALCPIAEINIPATVRKIGERAFSYCNSLKRVSFSTRVTSFGDGAFYNCKNLNEIIVAYNNIDLFKKALPESFFDEENYQNATLYIPTGTADFFKNTDGWNCSRTLLSKEILFRHGLVAIFGDIMLKTHLVHTIPITQSELSDSQTKKTLQKQLSFSQAMKH